VIDPAKRTPPGIINQYEKLRTNVDNIAPKTNKIEEEFRSQNSGVRINQSGIQTGAGLKTTKFSIWWGS
jgi:hypothetical protein